MSAFYRKMQEAYQGQLTDSRGWGAVEKLVKERIQEAKAEAWDEGQRSVDLEYEHIFKGHPVPEGEMCEECCEIRKNPYRKESQ